MSELQVTYQIYKLHVSITSYIMILQVICFINYYLKCFTSRVTD